jgi:hypothetical protein
VSEGESTAEHASLGRGTGNDIPINTCCDEHMVISLGLLNNVVETAASGKHGQGTNGLTAENYD